MRNATPLLFLLLWSSYATAQNCLNAGLENGTLDGYTTYVGIIEKDGTVNIVDIPNFSAAQHRLMHVSEGVDSIARLFCDDNKNLPVVPPEGDEYTLRLGNAKTGAKAERVRLKFKVTPALTFFQLRYAVILNDPDHEDFEQPRFEMRVLDDKGIQLSCGEYSVRAAANIPGFETCIDGWRVRPWTTVGFELKSFLGQDIQIEILTTDCARGRHAGYAYFDATCEPLTISLEGYCPDNITATMRVTEGFIDYKWSTGDTTSSVKLDDPKPNEVYQVTVTSATGCTVVLKDTIPKHTDFLIPKFSQEPDLTFCRDTSYWFTPQGEHLHTIYSTAHDRVGTDFLINNQQSEPYTFIAQDFYGCFVDTLAFSLDKGPILVQTAIDSISCNGVGDGFIALSATSDFLPLQYYWEHGAAISTLDQLLAGRYAVTISDNIQCTSTISFDLKNPAPLVLKMIETQPITCSAASDGQVVLTIEGGVFPYDISWNTGALNTSRIEQVSADTYTVTVTDANNCTSQHSIIVEEPTPLLIDSTMSPITCLGVDDGEIEVNITGGVAPYDIHWKDDTQLVAQSRKNLPTGEYGVIVRDQLGCIKEARFQLKEPSYNSLCGVYIPIVFSPNDDGINDVFYVMSGNEKISIESMQIFNRWGDLVFDNNGDCPFIGTAACGWSGRINDQPVSVDLYAYIIVLRMEGVAQSFLFKGEVSILK